MVRLDEFNPEMSEIDRLSETDRLHLRTLKHVVLFKLVADQTDRELGRVNRNVNLTQHIRKCTDVILMTVGDHKPLHLADILL